MTDDSDLARQMLEVIPPIMRMIRAELRESAHSEFTIPQLRILTHLDQGTETASQLAELQGCRPPVITKMIDGLVERDLVRRKQDEKNRRQITLSLTRKGVHSLRRAQRAAQAMLKTRIEKLSPDQKKTLQSGLCVFDELLRLHGLRRRNIRKH